MKDYTSKLRRRSFLLQAGGALSATLASTAALARAPAVAPLPNDRLELALQALQAEQAIRELHRRLLADLPSARGCVGAEVAAALVGIRRLQDRHDQAPLIRVDARAATATARFACRAERQEALEPSLPHLEMARLQGQGVHWQWEDGAYEAHYQKVAGAWRLLALRWEA